MRSDSVIDHVARIVIAIALTVIVILFAGCTSNDTTSNDGSGTSPDTTAETTVERTEPTPELTTREPEPVQYDNTAPVIEYSNQETHVETTLPDTGAPHEQIDTVVAEQAESRSTYEENAPVAPQTGPPAGRDLTQTPSNCLPSCEGAAILRGEVPGVTPNPNLKALQDRLLAEQAAQRGQS